MWQIRCQLCLRRAEAALCRDCWRQVPKLTTHSSLLAEGLPHIAYAAYASPLKQMLYNIKYHGARELAWALGLHLGRWYLQKWPKPELIVPVPLHSLRLAERGYNQAYELAKGLSEALNVPAKELLARQRPTPALYDLDPQERQAVLKDAFDVPAQQRIAPAQRVLLVDDILTTGSTLRSAADCLRPLTDRVVSLTLARALLSEA